MEAHYNIKGIRNLHEYQAQLWLEKFVQLFGDEGNHLYEKFSIEYNSNFINFFCSGLDERNKSIFAYDLQAYGININ